MMVSASQCDQCGEIVTDLDVGFSPGRHEMVHDCGGTWRIIVIEDLDPAPGSRGE